MTTHGSTRPGRSALPAFIARAAALALLLVLLLVNDHLTLSSEHLHMSGDRLSI